MIFDAIALTQNDETYDQFVETQTNDFIEQLMKFVRFYVARQCRYVANNQNETHFNRATQSITMQIVALTYEHEIERFFIDDIRDFVYTYFHSFD